MREIVHLQAGQCGNQIGAKVREFIIAILMVEKVVELTKVFHEHTWFMKMNLRFVTLILSIVM